MIKLSRRGFGIILALTIVAAILIPGADLPVNGQESAPMAVVTPMESPDSQRFDPVTPGMKIKQDKERVQKYMAVPSPENSAKTQKPKPPETESGPPAQTERP